MRSVIVTAGLFAIAAACSTQQGSYCEKDHDLIMAYHSQLRRAACATGKYNGVYDLKWDEKLAKAAFDDAQRTIIAVGRNQGAPALSNAQRRAAVGNAYRSVGRNLMLSSADVSDQQSFWLAAISFAEGKKTFGADRLVDECMRDSKSTCVRYAQMVASASTTVGCGRASSGGKWVVSCWYGESGVTPRVAVFDCMGGDAAVPMEDEPDAVMAPVPVPVPVAVDNMKPIKTGTSQDPMEAMMGGDDGSDTGMQGSAAPPSSCSNSLGTWCEADQSGLIAHHNELRAEACPAGTKFSGTVNLVYDEELAKLAYEQAKESALHPNEKLAQTTYAERRKLTNNKYKNVGEFVFSSSVKLDAKKATLQVSQLLATEKQYFPASRDPGKCTAPAGRSCTHYAQQVSDLTTKVGCGWYQGNTKWHLSCWYAEGGVYINVPAYSCLSGQESAPQAYPWNKPDDSSYPWTKPDAPSYPWNNDDGSDGTQVTKKITFVHTVNGKVVKTTTTTTTTGGSAGSTTSTTTTGGSTTGYPAPQAWEDEDDDSKCHTKTSTYCYPDQLKLMQHHSMLRRSACGFFGTFDGPQNLIYDPDLAKEAHAEAIRMSLGTIAAATLHSLEEARPNRVNNKYKTIGENLQVFQSASNSASDLLYAASKRFSVGSSSVSKTTTPADCAGANDCGDYLQQVSPTTTHIGCGLVKKGLITYVACWYGERGMAPGKPVLACRGLFG